MGETAIQREADDFETWCRDQAGHSELTASTYANYVRQLEKPVDIEAMELEEIIRRLKAHVTVPAIRSAYKKYLRWKRQTGEHNIATRKDIDFAINELSELDVRESEKLTKTKVLKRYLTTDEVAAFYDHARKLSPSRFSTLDYAHRKCAEFKLLPVFLFETAARIREALNVTTTNLDLDEGRVKIRYGKGGKTRRVDIDRSITLLRDHISRFDIDGELFLLDRETEYWKIRYEMLRLGNLDDLKLGDVTPHWFRHSYATNWCTKELKKGRGQAEIKEEIRDYLGHEETETTEAYIHAAEELTRENIYREHGGFDLDI